ncbi:hypothetical protein ABWH96_18950 [Marivirga tractuosa]|uniref:hypothetical protein n=1 Tax=Marivirga tractuosa TaxID=1006 RepID=UPI0035CEFB8C
MRTLNTLLIFTSISLALYSCSDLTNPDNNEPEPISIHNRTSETILVIDKSTREEILVEPDESMPLKEYGSITDNYIFKLPSDEEKFVYFEYSNDGKFIFAIYDFYLQYIITGSNGAEEASLTWETSNGGTGQNTVNLPYTIEYDTPFSDDFYYISAQIENGYGTIKVEIINRFGNVVDSDAATGEFAIATASD